MQEARDSSLDLVTIVPPLCHKDSETRKVVHFGIVLTYAVIPPDETLKPFLSGNPIKGHRQTVQTQIRRHIMWRLMRAYTVC